VRTGAPAKRFLPKIECVRQPNLPGTRFTVDIQEIDPLGYGMIHGWHRPPMDGTDLPASETGQVFRDFLRDHLREMICDHSRALLLNRKFVHDRIEGTIVDR